MHSNSKRCFISLTVFVPLLVINTVYQLKHGLSSVFSAVSSFSMPNLLYSLSTKYYSIFQQRFVPILCTNVTSLTWYYQHVFILFFILLYKFFFRKPLLSHSLTLTALHSGLDSACFALACGFYYRELCLNVPLPLHSVH